MQIELKNIRITYPQSGHVLDCINLQIDKGNFVGIIGKSGSGKTTLLETIGGFHKPQEGFVFFEGLDIYSEKFDQLNFRRKLQIIFQFPEKQFFENNVYDETAFGLRMLKYPADEINCKTLNILKKLSIDDEISRTMSPFSLSGGQKRKLSIACALVLEPEVLLLDEPFAGLDGTGKDNLIQILQEEKKKGTTILFVSHDPNLLCEIADKIIVLSEGKIVRTGTPAEIYTPDNMNLFGIGLPSTRETADLISLDMSEDLTYDSFISKLVNKLSSKIS